MLRILSQELLLQSGEALRHDVWSYLGLVLLPDVVAWRFSMKSQDRYMGGVRNTFQRLWVKAVALDRGEEIEDQERRWELLDRLSEDATVQIFERGSIVASPGLARAIAETWLKITDEKKPDFMEAIMRVAVKLIRIRNEIVDLSLLSEEARMAEVGELFERAMEVVASQKSEASGERNDGGNVVRYPENEEETGMHIVAEEVDKPQKRGLFGLFRKG